MLLPKRKRWQRTVSPCPPPPPPPPMEIAEPERMWCQAGATEAKQGWLPVHSASHSSLRPSLGRRETGQLLNLVFVHLSLPPIPGFTLAFPSPPAFSLPRSLSRPSSSPSPFHPSLKRISCFLILSSPSELRITLGSQSSSPASLPCPSLHPLLQQLRFSSLPLPVSSLLLLPSCVSFLSRLTLHLLLSLSPLHLKETH